MPQLQSQQTFFVQAINITHSLGKGLYQLLQSCSAKKWITFGIYKSSKWECNIYHRQENDTINWTNKCIDIITTLKKLASFKMFENMENEGEC